MGGPFRRKSLRKAADWMLRMRRAARRRFVPDLDHRTEDEVFKNDSFVILSNGLSIPADYVIDGPFDDSPASAAVDEEKAVSAIVSSTGASYGGVDVSSMCAAPGGCGSAGLSSTGTVFAPSQGTGVSVTRAARLVPASAAVGDEEIVSAIVGAKGASGGDRGGAGVCSTGAANGGCDAKDEVSKNDSFGILGNDLSVPADYVVDGPFDDPPASAVVGEERP